MIFRLLRALLFLWTMAFAALGWGQIPDPVRWTATMDPAAVQPGGRATLVLHATIEKPWHLYSLTPVENGPFTTQITVLPNDSIAEIGKPSQATPLKKVDPNFKIQVEYYEGEGEFRIPVRLSKKASGSVDVSAKVVYQTCNEGTCLPPRSKDLKATVQVSGAAVDDATPIDAPSASAVKKSPPATPPVTEIDQAKAKGLLAYLAFAVVAGFGALLTPCVFPMIPITVSFFSKKKEGESALKKASAYCFGIVATFTALGVLVSAIFGAAGLTTFANNPYLNLVLALVFIALAFSLFGFFEVGIPSSILTKLDSSGKTGLIGPIVMGLTFSLTSFTCTLPFVGTVLVSASQGDYLWPILGMVAWSAAFSLPFFFLALFPSTLARVPRSGAWLGVVKAFMGFVELAAAVKFVSSVDLGIVPNGLGIVTREVFLAVWFGIAFLAAMYLFGIVRLPKVDDPKIGPFRIGMGILTLVAGGYALAGINGASLGRLGSFLPPTPYPGREAKAGQGERLAWLDDYDAALAQAKREGKPLFVDFTGKFCTSCRDMESNMFPRPEVEERMKRFVLVRLYTDRLTPSDNANQRRLQTMTNSITLPSYVTIDTGGTQGISPWQPDPEKFAAFLDRGLGKTLSASR